MKKAFTLIELLIVIAIIGILATIVVMTIKGVGGNGEINCEVFKYRSINNMPAQCINHFINTK